MSDYPRFTLNRDMVMLCYKQPFLDWANAADPNPRALTLEEVNDDGEIFLVPADDSLVDPVETAEDAVRWVEKRRRMFFDHMLGDWLTDESLGPQKRTLKMFREWFFVEYRSMVWDMADEPLVVEDWEEGDGIPKLAARFIDIEVIGATH